MKYKCIICGCLMKSSEPLLPDRMIVFGSQVPSLTYALECANGHDFLMYSLSGTYYYTISRKVVKTCRSLSHRVKKDRSSGLWIISEYPDYSLALDFKKWWQFWK